MQVAVSCRVAPTAIVGVAGVTDINCRVAAVTVSIVLPETLPDVAVMTDEPAPTPVARPLATTVAAEVVPDVQVITATSGSVSGSTTLTVTAATLQSISVTFTARAASRSKATW